MADKAISDLTQALQITNEDLFVLEQSGEAKKLPGKTLLKYVAMDVMTVTVTTLPAGSQATAVYNKQTGNLTLGIPQGPKGDTGTTGATGPANVLTIGSVTSGAVASASITGDAPNQVLNLVLQKGDKGDTGDKGEQGEQGKQGIQGEIGPQGNPGADAPTITGITIRQSDYHMIVTLSNGTSYDAGYCRGASGAGTGDMLASVYDPTGKNQDIFAYIDNAIAGIPTPPSASDATPKAPGTAAAGSETAYSREDHVHPKELPTVAASDNGKFLRVVDGVWAAASVPNANGVSF
nr:MAG TPA: collagen alpha 1(VIII) chain protein [Caudoviricetes sp.]